MKIAHLILAHNGPKQLERLITRLSNPDSAVYIHLDKKTAIGPFEYLMNYPNVYFIKKRVKVYWGAYNIVKATFNGFKEIIRHDKGYKFINLLSGQDYPLKSQQFIHDFLSQNPNTAFMNYLHFEPDWLEASPRIKLYHFNSFTIKGRYLLQKLVNKIFPVRKFPNDHIPVGRSQWFTIPIECAEFILNYWDKNPKLRMFIKFTWAPDEFIFQTILYNSRFKENMVNNDLRYIDWSGGGVSPKTLTVEDVPKLLASGKLFARKFNLNNGAEVFNLIDAEIDSV